MKILLKVLEKLKKKQPSSKITDAYLGCQYDKGWNDAIEKVEKLINSYSLSDMWIPVDVKLPPEPKNLGLGIYLVTAKEREYPFVAVWNGKDFFNCDKETKAIAWMPLPEPYKENKHE